MIKLGRPVAVTVVFRAVQENDVFDYAAIVEIHVAGVDLIVAVPFGVGSVMCKAQKIYIVLGLGEVTVVCADIISVLYIALSIPGSLYGLSGKSFNV